MDLLETFRQEAGDLTDQLVAWRRDFHQHPELGFEEVRTAGIVADHLRDLGLEVSTGIGKTGVVAMVEPDDVADDAPVVLLRFDMDALPIFEQNDVPYRSQNDGVMHACGHDGHTAIGMGTAQLLARHRNDLPGRVKLVFQPAEEGIGGAMAMIDDGVLENPKPSASFAPPSVEPTAAQSGDRAGRTALGQRRQVSADGARQGRPRRRAPRDHRFHIGGGPDCGQLAEHRGTQRQSSPMRPSFRWANSTAATPPTSSRRWPSWRAPIAAIPKRSVNCC